MFATDAERAAILAELITESRDHLQQGELSLLALENDPESSSELAQVFRALHSIKGSASFLALHKVEQLADIGETWLTRVREGHERITSESTASLLQLIDALRNVFAELERSGVEGELPIEPVIARIKDARMRAERAPQKVGEPIEDEPGEGARAIEALSLRPQADQRVRVDVTLLDRLMTLVSELVIARNQIAQLASARPNADLQAPAHELSRVTADLQALVMRARMQPIHQLWTRLPRVVRDLALGAGKQARLVLEGAETELDKTLLEAVGDPLAHVLRNAIDHGIEAPEVRRAAGKPSEGTLTLRAFHEGGTVHVELSDDGAGIDLAQVQRIAVARGLLSAQAAARLTPRETLALLFLPGFTTTAHVTALSGRGVGMDVVRTNIERIGGVVDIDSTLGVGTRVQIRVPLTLAIVSALVVRCGDERFAIPQTNLLEVVRVGREHLAREIASVSGATVFRLRGRLLPLGDLRTELGLQARASVSDAMLIVVLQTDDKTFGLVVDGVGDTEEIVVRPLWAPLQALGCFSGATVRGDGRVALILDASGLARRLGVGTLSLRPSPRDDSARHAPSEELERLPEAVLLCTVQGASRLAIPLAQVTRLEELPRASVEHIGDRAVAQCRGEVLPLIDVAHALEERRREPRDADTSNTAVATTAAAHSEHLQVVVHQSDERSVGLVVDSVLDIAHVVLAPDRRSARAGTLGSMVVDSRVTELLDLPSILSRTEQHGATSEPHHGATRS